MNNNFDIVDEKLNKALKRANRKSTDFTLIAVTKTFDNTVIEPLIKNGHIHFGENKIQECRDKWTILKEKYPDVILHLIGSIQTNKVKYLPKLVDYIHSIDRESLAKEIRKNMDNSNAWNPKCFIQVNTGEEPQKSGVLPDNLDELVEICTQKYNLNIIGLMSIPPINDNPAVHFAYLRKLARRNNLKELSMGMSNDYETAVDFEATFVRIGTAIFKKRGV